MLEHGITDKLSRLTPATAGEFGRGFVGVQLKRRFGILAGEKLNWSRSAELAGFESIYELEFMRQPLPRLNADEGKNLDIPCG